MDIKHTNKLIERYEELTDALSMKVKINHEQVDYITLTSLLEKYSGIIKRGNVNSPDAAAFEKVLIYYISNDELIDIKQMLIDS